jgi:hypothetical protein
MPNRGANVELKPELLHPVYLDVAMLISFLATLDDGVSFSSEVAQTRMQGTKSSGQVEGTAKLPSIASLLGLDLNASGKYARDKNVDDTTENKFVKQHTAASLFNRLRALLVRDQIVTKLGPETNLSTVSPGSVIEVDGTLEETPLKKMVDIFGAISPFLDGQQEIPAAPVGPNRRQQRQGGVTPEQQQALQMARAAREVAVVQQEQNSSMKKMVDLVGEDLARSPVVDLVFRSPGISGLITANREYLSDDVTAALIGGQFRVLGKVTAVDTSADAETLVVRRGAMGAIAEASVLPMLEQMQENSRESGLNLDLPEGKITGPYVQVIPLAIFV